MLCTAGNFNKNNLISLQLPYYIYNNCIRLRSLYGVFWLIDFYSKGNKTTERFTSFISKNIPPPLSTYKSYCSDTECALSWKQQQTRLLQELHHILCDSCYCTRLLRAENDLKNFWFFSRKAIETFHQSFVTMAPELYHVIWKTS